MMIMTIPAVVVAMVVHVVVHYHRRRRRVEGNEGIEKTVGV